MTAPNPALAAGLKQHQFQLMTAHDQISTTRGDPVAYNVGGQTVFGTRNAYTGAYQPQGGSSGSVTNTLSPEAAVSPQTGTPDPNTGAPTTITLGQRAEQSGLAPVGTYTAGGGSGAIPVRLSLNGTITKQRQALGQPMAPSAAPIVTGVSPG